MSNQKNKLFSEGKISHVFDSTMASITNEIESLEKDFLRKLNTNEYLDSMVRKHTIVLPAIEFENAYFQTYQKDVPATYFPDSYKIPDYKSQKTAFIQYFIPVNDKDKLLCYQPCSQTPEGGMDFIVSSGSITKAYGDLNNEPKKIQKIFDSEVAKISINYKGLISDIKAFNKKLIAYCIAKFESRQNKLLIQ